MLISLNCDTCLTCIYHKSMIFKSLYSYRHGGKFEIFWICYLKIIDLERYANDHIKVQMHFIKLSLLHFPLCTLLPKYQVK